MSKNLNYLAQCLRADAERVSKIVDDYKKEIERLTDDLKHTLSERDAYMQLSDKMTVERDTLRTFAQHIMESWPCGDVDGGDLQDKAVKLGLLKLTEPAPREPCGEGCNCAEYCNADEFASGEVQCYKRTALLMGEKG